jgi:hypothetical protein
MERKQFTAEQIIQILKVGRKERKTMCLYSTDFRLKIVRAYERGEGSQRQLARVFGVSLGFFQGLLQRYRTGGVEPKPHGGRNPGQISQHAAAVNACITSSPMSRWRRNATTWPGERDPREPSDPESGTPGLGLTRKKRRSGPRSRTRLKGSTLAPPTRKLFRQRLSQPLGLPQHGGAS